MDEDKLLEMAEHFRKLASQSSCLASASDLKTLAAEYETASRALVSSGEATCCAPLSLPGVRL